MVLDTWRATFCSGNQTITYEGLDFSEVFFEIARETVGDMIHRATLTKGDLMNQSWPENLSKRPGAIISTWALHDRNVCEANAHDYLLKTGMPNGGRMQMWPAVGLSRQTQHADSS